MDDLVSIVIPVYNAEQYIERCVQELIQQTHKNIEIILVNDGSTDSTGILCDLLASRLNNVKCLHQKNMGVSAARNRGTQIATGDYIMYMDADDYLVSTAISEGLKYIHKFCVDMVIAREIEINQNQRMDITPLSNSKYTILNSEEFDELRRKYLGFSSLKLDSLAEKGTVSGRPCERLIRAEIAKETEFPSDVPLGEDKLWNLRLLNKCNTVCVLGACWYKYIIYNDSVVRKYHGNRREKGELFIRTLYVENKEFCDTNKNIFLENIAIMLYCVAFYDLVSEKCPMSNKEKKAYIAEMIRKSPWKILWKKPNNKYLSVVHRLMLPLYTTGQWIYPLTIYKKIKTVLKNQRSKKKM